MVAPANGSVIDGLVTVSAQATNVPTISSFRITVDGKTLCSGPVAVLSCQWDTTGSQAGTHTFQAWATDALGNAGFDTVTVTVRGTPATTLFSGERHQPRCKPSLPLCWYYRAESIAIRELRMRTSLDSRQPLITERRTRFWTGTARTRMRFWPNLQSSSLKVDRFPLARQSNRRSLDCTSTPITTIATGRIGSSSHGRRTRLPGTNDSGERSGPKEGPGDSGRTSP